MSHFSQVVPCVHLFGDADHPAEHITDAAVGIEISGGKIVLRIQAALSYHIELHFSRIQFRYLIRPFLSIRSKTMPNNIGDN